MSNPLLVRILRAVGDETRLRLLGVLMRGAFHVNELIDILDLGQSRVSRHLGIMADAGLVLSRREGHFVFYFVPDHLSPVARAAMAFLDEAKRLGGMDLLPVEEKKIHAVWDARRSNSAAAFNKLPGQWTRDHERYFGSPDSIECLRGHLRGKVETAIDLGTGSGNLLPVLANSAERIIAVDHSPDLLSRAQAQADRLGLSNIEYRLGTLEHIPVHDAAVDLAVVNMVLHHVAEPAAVFKEIRRVLVPGGRILVGDYVLHDHEWMRAELGDQWLGFDPAQMRQWLKRAGFSSIEIKREKSDSSDLQILVASAEAGDARES